MMEIFEEAGQQTSLLCLTIALSVMFEVRFAKTIARMK